MVVALTDDPNMIPAYSEAGGLFTDREFARGWTSEMLASDKSKWFAETMPGRGPVNNNFRTS